MDYFNELTKLLENGKETDAILMMKDHDKKFNKYQEFNGNTIMTFAIKKNLQLFANTLLNDDLLINMPDAYGNAPLNLCINRNNEFLALQLIKLKCEMNVENKNNVLPVFLALDKGMFSVVKSIVVSMKNSNSINTNGNNLLLECIDKADGNNNKEYVSLGEELILAGINLHYTNQNKNSPNYGENALTLALKKGSIDLARWIIKKGEGLNIEDKNGIRPLTICIEKKYEKLGINIIQKDIETSYYANGNTFLTSAIKNEMHTIADILVEKGFTLDAPDENGVFPIGLSIEKGFEKLTTKIYNKNNKDKNKLANQKEYPLTLAIKNKQSNIAKNIIDIDKGKAINVYNKDGDSPFSLALKSGMDDVCNYMINNGLDLNVLSDNIETHLTLAIKTSRLEIAKNLLNKGIEIKANRMGKSPQNICKELNMTSFLNVIETHIDPYYNKKKRFNIEEDRIENPKVIIKPDNFNHQPIIEQQTEKEKQAEALREKIKRML